MNRADEDHFRFCWHLSSIPKVSNILVRRRSFVLTLRDSYHNTSHIIMCVDHVSHIHNMTHATIRDVFEPLASGEASLQPSDPSPAIQGVEIDIIEPMPIEVAQFREGFEEVSFEDLFADDEQLP